MKKIIYIAPALSILGWLLGGQFLEKPEEFRKNSDAPENSQNNLSQAKKLQSQKTYEITSHSTFTLPENPRLNDSIYFVIRSQSLHHPAQIKYTGHKILNKKEDLILDSLANFNLVFKGSRRGWVLA